MYRVSRSHELPSQLRVGPAIRIAEARHYASAQGLVARRYAERGYISSDLSTHADGSVVVCSAFEGQTTVGTIAVRYESEQGLKADVIFGPELNEMRAAGLRLCEFGRLALDLGVSENKALLARLFHLAFLHAYRLAACELLVIEVNPRHVPFYRRMLGFKVCSDVRLNLSVNAPAVLMSLDLLYAAEQIGIFGGCPANSTLTRTLYPYAYSPADEGAILSKLRQ